MQGPRTNVLDQAIADLCSNVFRTRGQLSGTVPCRPSWCFVRAIVLTSRLTPNHKKFHRNLVSTMTAVSPPLNERLSSWPSGSVCLSPFHQPFRRTGPCASNPAGVIPGTKHRAWGAATETARAWFSRPGAPAIPLAQPPAEEVWKSSRFGWTKVPRDRPAVYLLLWLWNEWAKKYARIPRRQVGRTALCFPLF